MVALKPPSENVLLQPFLGGSGDPPKNSSTSPLPPLGGVRFPTSHSHFSPQWVTRQLISGHLEGQFQG